MEDIKNKIETVLFTVGRFVTIEELSRMSGVGSSGYVQEVLQNLKEEYEKRNGALFISREGNKWKLAVKKEYLYLTESLLTDSELDKPSQETLAIIAYKQPILQSDVIKIRGNGAYDHIKTLKEQSFITSERSGRTRILKLPPKFYDYFDVVDDTLREKFVFNEDENKTQ